MILPSGIMTIYQENFIKNFRGDLQFEFKDKVIEDEFGRKFFEKPQIGPLYVINRIF